MAQRKRLTPHLDFPKRRIVRREVQNGTNVIVMECQHTMVGKPASRYSRFYPCSDCYDLVQKVRKDQVAEGDGPDLTPEN
jgi:hypothetical protein